MEPCDIARGRLREAEMSPSNRIACLRFDKYDFKRLKLSFTIPQDFRIVKRIL